jgi:hypothetical protein
VRHSNWTARRPQVLWCRPIVGHPARAHRLAAPTDCGRWHCNFLFGRVIGTVSDGDGDSHGRRHDVRLALECIDIVVETSVANTRGWKFPRKALSSNGRYLARLEKLCRDINSNRVTLNQRVLGSSPSAPTKPFQDLRHIPPAIPISGQRLFRPAALGSRLARGGKTDDLTPPRGGTATSICRKLRELAFGLEQSSR